MEEKQEENFDREAYLKNDEQFEDIEIVVPGRTVSKVNRKHVSSIVQRTSILKAKFFEKIFMVISTENFLTFLKLQERAEKLYLHYIQRWAKDYLRRRLDWIVDDLYGRQEYASNTNPRHLNSALCPCQVYSENIFASKSYKY